jgi:excisionase family DNA binding protein
VTDSQDLAAAVMRPQEVAELFRVDPKTVTRWAAEGKLPFFRTPRRAPALPPRRGRGTAARRATGGCRVSGDGHVISTELRHVAYSPVSSRACWFWVCSCGRQDRRPFGLRTQNGAERAAQWHLKKAAEYAKAGVR